jgi:hypothetical protein
MTLSKRKNVSRRKNVSKRKNVSRRKNVSKRKNVSRRKSYKYKKKLLGGVLPSEGTVVYQNLALDHDDINANRDFPTYKSFPIEDILKDPVDEELQMSGFDYMILNPQLTDEKIIVRLLPFERDTNGEFKHITWNDKRGGSPNLFNGYGHSSLLNSDLYKQLQMVKDRNHYMDFRNFSNYSGVIENDPILMTGVMYFTTKLNLCNNISGHFPATSLDIKHAKNKISQNTGSDLLIVDGKYDINERSNAMKRLKESQVPEPQPEPHPQPQPHPEPQSHPLTIVPEISEVEKSRLLRLVHAWHCSCNMWREWPLIGGSEFDLTLFDSLTDALSVLNDTNDPPCTSFHGYCGQTIRNKLRKNKLIEGYVNVDTLNTIDKTNEAKAIKDLKARLNL